MQLNDPQYNQKDNQNKILYVFPTEQIIAFFTAITYFRLPTSR